MELLEMNVEGSDELPTDIDDEGWENDDLKMMVSVYWITARLSAVTT